MNSKQPNQVRGNIINCPKFIQCPLCYGCRNYSSHDLECIECNKNAKHNICNINLHKADLIANFITKDVIKIKEEMEFE